MSLRKKGKPCGSRPRRSAAVTRTPTTSEQYRHLIAAGNALACFLFGRHSAQLWLRAYEKTVSPLLKLTYHPARLAVSITAPAADCALIRSSRARESTRNT